MRTLLGISLLLTACESASYVTPEGAIGLGLTAGVGVALPQCDTALVNKRCWEEALTIEGARATSNAATIVRFDEDRVTLRGDQPGMATGTISTASNGTIDFEIPIVPLVEHEMALWPSEPDPFWNQTVAQLTETSLSYKQVNRYEASVSPDSSVFLADARGYTEVGIDPGATEATVVDASDLHIRWYVATGPLPGQATLTTALGFELPFEIVGPRDISALGIYGDTYVGEPLARLTSIPLVVIDDPAMGLGRRMKIIPSHADGRPIIGCPPEDAATPRPIIESTSSNVSAWIPGGDEVCHLEVIHTAAGPGSVTVSWGAQRAVLSITDVVR